MASEPPFWSPTLSVTAPEPESVLVSAAEFPPQAARSRVSGRSRTGRVWRRMSTCFLRRGSEGGGGGLLHAQFGEEPGPQPGESGRADRAGPVESDRRVMG